MKNTKKIICMLMTACLIVTGTIYSPITASATAYKKSVSKKITVPATEEYSRVLKIKLKKVAYVTITIQATDGKSDNFFFLHGSDCGCNTVDARSSEGKKKITFKSEYKLAKGKHLFTFDSKGDFGGKTFGKKQNIKITIKANNAILKIVNLK